VDALKSLAGALLLVASSGQAQCLDRDLYAELLSRYTQEVPDTAGVRVAYAPLAGSTAWRRLVDGLDSCDVVALDTRAKRLAFWIDVYNVLAIDMVVRHQPVESIRDIGSFLRPVWKQPAGRIAGRDYSLDEIEHGILRPLGDARIHAAIVCASTSCPSLQRQPFDAERIDAQLDAALGRFVSDPRKGVRFDAGARTLWLSRIFDWFAEDFEAGGGIPRSLEPYLQASIRASLAEAGEVRIRYLDYDWRTNDLGPGD